jgi:hypothetical protein
VDSSRRNWPAAFERLERLDSAIFHGYSGHHGVTGILAAAGPGIRPGELPAGAEITQLPATLLSLLGLAADGLDAGPIGAILDLDAPLSSVQAAAPAPVEQPVYSEEEEQRLIERLRDLGYE